MKTATQPIGSPPRYGAGWLVPSQTRRGVQYYVNAAVTRCTCKAFAYRGGTCKHLRVVLEANALIEEVLGDA
jgi:hypothetical protein